MGSGIKSLYAQNVIIGGVRQMANTEQTLRKVDEAWQIYSNKRQFADDEAGRLLWKENRLLKGQVAWY